ncbi:hypothetical protein JNJ66_00150 [Candidatus Saccharibacteria bacterium]|nr:hypothetical protein [Candidatus Saccharibacteria bacterium]
METPAAAAPQTNTEPTTTPAPMPAATHAGPTPQPGQPNYLAAFLLTLFLGFVGTNRLYTRHYATGWLRCLLFTFVFIAPVFFLVDMTLGTVALVAGVAANAAAVLWWYIDLWIYFGGTVRDRKTGQQLHRDSPRDYAYAKNMMVSMHAAVILLVLAVVVGIGLAVTYVQQLPMLQGLGDPGGGSSAIDSLLKLYTGGL